MAEEATPAETRVIRLYYVTAEEVAAAVTPLASEIGTITASPAAVQGIAPDRTGAGGDLSASLDYLVIHDYPDRIDQMERVIELLDVRPQQVLVEATILRATLDDENQLGVDFTIVGGVDLEMLGSTSTGITNITPGPLPVGRFEEFNTIVNTDFSEAHPSAGLTFGMITSSHWVCSYVPSSR